MENQEDPFFAEIRERLNKQLALANYYRQIHQNGGDLVNLSLALCAEAHAADLQFVLDKTAA